MSEATLAPWPWAAAPGPVIERIVSSLCDTMPAEPVYLLIDPAFGEPDNVQVPPLDAALPEACVTAARAQAWQRDVHSLHSSRWIGRSAAALPYIVRLLGTADELMSISVRSAIDEHLRACAIGEGTYRFGGWIQPYGTSRSECPACPQGVADHEGWRLAKHLSCAIEARDAQRRIVPLRLTDRRVLNTLQGSANIDWRAAMRGIRRWCWLDYNLELRTLDGQPGPSCTGGVWNARPDPLLAQCGAIHRTQTLLLAKAFPLEDRDQQAIPRKLDAAHARGLRTDADKAAFACEAIREPAFEAFDGLDALIAYVAKTGQEMSDAIALNRSHWASRQTYVVDEQD